MKVYFLTESQLQELTKNLVVEQSNQSQIPKKFGCIPMNQSLAVEYAISQKVSPFFVKYGLGILGRESDFGKVFGKFGIKAAPEYVMNKLSEIVPGFEEVLQWGAKKIFNKDNWVPSMGIAQMTPDIAKKYGVDLEDLMTLSGSLYAVSKHLSDMYNELSKYYDTNKPSKIIYSKKLIDNPSSTGNAALDAAILSYNLGDTRFKKQYCKTNNPAYLAPCDEPGGVYKPFPKENPNLIIKIDKNQVIRNYIPNIQTDTTEISQKVINVFSDTPKKQYISSLGYLKEVNNYAKKFNCIK